MYEIILLFTDIWSFTLGSLLSHESEIFVCFAQQSEQCQAYAICSISICWINELMIKQMNTSMLIYKDKDIIALAYDFLFPKINSFFFFFCFLGLYLRHMESSWLGSIWNCSCQPMPQPQQWGWQRGIGTTSVNTTHSNTRSLTHWARPGVEPTSSWKLVVFITAEPRWELLQK